MYIIVLVSSYFFVLHLSLYFIFDPFLQNKNHSIYLFFILAISQYNHLRFVYNTPKINVVCAFFIGSLCPLGIIYFYPNTHTLWFGVTSAILLQTYIYSVMIRYFSLYYKLRLFFPSLVLSILTYKFITVICNINWGSTYLIGAIACAIFFTNEVLLYKTYGQQSKHDTI